MKPILADGAEGVRKELRPIEFWKPMNRGLDARFQKDMDRFAN
jgi:hypothetical protein